MGRPPDTTVDALVDANVLIAFLAGDGHPFHIPAAGIMGRMDCGEIRLIVTPVVVAEVVWSAKAALGLSRESMAALLRDVLESDGFEIAEREVVMRALDLLVDHPRLGMADAYLAGRATTVGPPSIASFDRDLDQITGVRRLTA